MAEERRRVVTLSKAQAETAAGRGLVDLLTELSADGNVTRERWTGSELGWKSIAASTSLPCPFFTKHRPDFGRW